MTKSQYESPLQNQNTCVEKPDCVTSIRRKARTLREQSVKLDRLADELQRCSFSQDADETLWSFISR